MNARQLAPNPYGRIIQALEQSLREILYQHIDPLFKQWVKNVHNVGLIALHLVSNVLKGNKIEVPSHVLNLSLSQIQKEDLKSGKETELIEGFISKRGNLFSAYLKMDEDGKLVFRFPEAGEAQKKFRLPDQVLGVTLGQEQKTKLENKEETDLIEGLVGKKGIPFSAYLKIDEAGSIQFRFPDRQSTVSQKTGPEQNKQDLPVQEQAKEKFIQDNPETDQILRNLVVYGKRIPEAQIEKLKLHQKTDMIEGFVTKSGKVFSAVLELKNNKLSIHIPARKINTGISVVPKKIMGVEISAQNRRLLNWGRKSELIKGMKTPEGIVFSGWLKMDQDKKLLVKSSPSTIHVDLDKKGFSMKAADPEKKEMGL